MKPIFKFDIVQNKSKTYMLPLLMKHVDIKFENFIENTYLSFQDGDDLFCILYKWSSVPYVCWTCRLRRQSVV